MARDLGAVYVRLSQQDEDEESLDRQQADGIADIQSRGLTPVLFREPPGVRSGYYEKRRPEWQRLRKELGASSRYAAVWFADLSRASRNRMTTLEFVDWLTQHNIEFISQKEQIDLRTAAGKALLGVLAVFNQWYRDDISERKQRQYRARDPNIYASNVHPFGMTRTGHYPNITWTTTEDFPIVLKMLDLYVSGKGARNIAYEMDRLGYTWRNRRGERSHFREWTVLHAIQSVERYKPFLDPDLYRRVWEIRESRRRDPFRTKQTKRPPLLLKGILFCAYCGNRIKTSTEYIKRSYGMYVYPQYRHDSPECAHRRLWKGQVVNDLFMAYLEPLFRMPKDIREWVIAALTMPPDHAQQKENNLRRNKLELRLRNFETMRADGDITRERFQEIKQEIETELEQIPVLPPPPPPMSKDFAAALVDAFLPQFYALIEIDVETANLRLTEMIDRIEFDGHQIRVKWNPAFRVFESILERSFDKASNE